MALTATQIDAKITEIDAILDSGVSSTTVDGITTNFDLKQLRSQRKYYARQLIIANGGTASRFNSVDLGGTV